MKTHIKSYLSITKKEWNGLVILVILIALVLAAPYVYQTIRSESTINFNNFDKAVAQLNKIEQQNFLPGSQGQYQKLPHPVMFAFNPNGLTVNQWEQLGLSQYQANIIKHYEAKGGKFYTADDVRKIYSIAPDDYERLRPYISFPKTTYTAKKAKPGVVIELNTADSAKLTTVRGIGPSFAARIITYRGRLGGFYYKEQLKEVFGIDSLKYAEIKNNVAVNPGLISKININTISFSQLRIFPYFSYKQVNALIQYRAQHGSYASMADIKNIPILDDVILRKIEPYLVFK